MADKFLKDYGITSLLLLIVLFPLAFLVAVIHKLESRGSLFIIQKRIGYDIDDH